MLGLFLVIFSEFNVFQILGMNLWNHGSDVMDALLDLIVNLVRGSCVFCY